MTIRLITDSSSDLPPAFAKERGISVVPLTISFGNDELRDGIDVSVDDFYRRLPASSQLPRTSQPSVEAFQRVFEEALEAGDDVLGVHLSAKLSGTLNSARVARSNLGPAGEGHIALVDSQNVSLGLAAIVLAASDAIAGGATLAEAVTAAEATRPRVHVVAALDTLEYLERGGRIGRASSLLGSLLRIKPLVQVENGEVTPFDRVRTHARALDRLFDVATESARLHSLWVGSSSTNRDERHALAERIRPALPGVPIFEADIGAVVGVHAGPGVLGVAPVRLSPA